MKPFVQVIHSVPSISSLSFLPASEIVNRIVRDFSDAYIGKKLSMDEFRHGFINYSSMVILSQFEKRSIPIHAEQVMEIVLEFKLDYNPITKNVDINISNELIEKLDGMLFTRKCLRCGLVIMNTFHGQLECDQILTQRVMES